MTPAAYPSLVIAFQAEGVQRRASVLLDTGFDGHLAIPEAIIDDLPAPTKVQRVRTASGETITVPVYLGTVELADVPGRIEADVIAPGDEYLLGIATLNHFRVTFDHGREVIVEP